MVHMAQFNGKQEGRFIASLTCAAPATVKQTSRKAQLSSHSHWVRRTSAWEGFGSGSVSPDTGQQGGCSRILRRSGRDVHALAGKPVRAFVVFVLPMKFISMPVRVAVLVLCSPVAVGVSAQQILPDVVVVGSRFEEPRLSAPSAVQIITREAIQNSGATSVPEILNMLGAVNVRSVAAGQLGFNYSVDLGGFGVTATQNTLILVDGRRINPIDSSDIVWGAIPLSSIQRIEVASGAAAVQYGAGASGGLINIITDRQNPDRTDVGVRLGSFGTLVTDFNLDRQIGDASFSLNAGASRTDGWRQNAQADSQHVSGRWRKTIDGLGYVFAEANASQQSNGFPGGVLGQVGQGDQRAAKFNNVGSENTVNQTTLRLGGFAALSERTSLDVDLVLGKKDSAFSQPYYDTPDSFNTTYGFLTGAGMSRMTGDEVSFSPKFRTEFSGGASLVYGFDVSKSRQDGANSFGPLAEQFILANQGPFQYQGNLLSDQQSVELLNQSIYMISRMPLDEALDLTLGSRRQLQKFDANDLNKSSGAQASSGTFDANAYEVALNVKFSAESRGYARLNQSYRFANTDEYWGYDMSGSRVFSGELQPQITHAYELGYDFKTVGQQFSLMVSNSTTQHEIRYNPGLFRNSNLEDEVNRTSLMASWAVQILDKTRLTLGARLQRAQFSTGTYAGQTLGLVPNAIFNLGWVQEVGEKNRVGLQAVHVSKQSYDATPDIAGTLPQMPAYTTVDAFWTRSYGKLDTRFTVKNLTGARYASYGGYGFVSTSGGGGAYSYYHFPADPRSMLLSLNYRF